MAEVRADTSQGTDPGGTSPQRRGLRTGLRQALSWTIAAAILWYLFRQVPLADAWGAAKNARLDVFAPLVVLAAGLWFLLESRAFAYLFSRFNTPVTWAEARSLRGLTYLLTPVNWNLGTAAIILSLRRSKRIGTVESASSMLFYAAIDGIVLGGLTLLGCCMLPTSVEIDQIGRAAMIFVGIQVALLALLMLPGADWRWLGRLRAVRLFRTHTLATWRELALLSLIRTCYFGVYVVLYWLGSEAFHVQVPFTFALAATPVIILASALPLTPAGLGTQQAAMFYLFAPYGSQAAILAFGIVLPVAVIVARIPLGLLYVRDVAALRTVEVRAED